jgi:hypothetical protein
MVEPLAAKTVVLVEGPADSVLLEAGAHALGRNLDRLAIAVTELGGADNFGTAYSFLGPEGFKVPLLGLVDEDHRSQWATVLGIDPQDIETAGFSVSQPDLEGEYVHSLGVTRVVEMLVSSRLFILARILSACAASDVSRLQAAALTTFCRAKKNKVYAATAVAWGITAAETAQLPAINRIISSLS